MNDRDKADLWTAVAIGAVVGVGAALLLRAEEEPRTKRLLRSLQPLQKKAGRAMRGARRGLAHGGGDLLHDSAKSLRGLRKDAARIVADARRELEDIASGSMKHARRTAKRAKRRFV